MKAGSVSVKADVTVCPMYFFGYYTKKSHYSSASSDHVVLKKGEKAYICFSKTGKYKSKADLVDRSILSPTEIRLFYTKRFLNARVVTYENKYVGIEIEALKDNEGEFFSVGIDGSGGLKKSFYVYVEK